MNRYRFQLESLQKLRESYRDGQRVRLAEAHYAQAQLAERANAVASELAELTALQRTALQSDNVDVNALVDHQRYEVVLKSQEQTLHQQAERLEEETERRREALAEAEQQVRVLEKLNERRYQEYQRTEARKEDQRLSEVALNQFVRKQRQPT